MSSGEKIMAIDGKLRAKNKAQFGKIGGKFKPIFEAFFDVIKGVSADAFRGVFVW